MHPCRFCVGAHLTAVCIQRRKRLHDPLLLDRIQHAAKACHPSPLLRIVGGLRAVRRMTFNKYSHAGLIKGLQNSGSRYHWQRIACSWTEKRKYFFLREFVKKCNSRLTACVIEGMPWNWKVIHRQESFHVACSPDMEQTHSPLHLPLPVARDCVHAGCYCEKG